MRPVGWPRAALKTVGDFLTFIAYSDTRVGWTAGGGIEHFISNPHVTVKAEALYVDLGRTTVTDTFGGGYTSRFKNTAVIGRLGLNLKW